MSEEAGKFRIGVYPGMFDPVTKGHLQMIRRASRMVDRLIVGVADNPRIISFFTIEERIAMVEEDIANLPDKGCEIIVKPVQNLLVHFAIEEGANCVFRGLRAVSDFEYEFQMTNMNAKLEPSLETVFLMAKDKWQFVSSSFVKEIASLGGNIDEFVTPQVAQKIVQKYSQ
jgi:pantetheine-phosphate adenylyltransferase